MTNVQQSYAKARMHDPATSDDADNVFYRNPYGDAEKVEQAQVPLLTNATQFGKCFSAPDIDKKLDNVNFIETRGPGSDMSEPRGMNTGFTGFGAGPGELQSVREAE